MNSNHAAAIRKASSANNLVNSGHDKNTFKKMAKTGHDFIAVSGRCELSAEPSAERSLGTNAESSTPPLKNTKIQSVRAERYHLQNSARDLLLWAGAKTGIEYPANFHKTAKCSHVRHGSNINVNKSIEHNSAFYSGLVVCGNVFTCPVCAAKIQERRRVEIAQAFDYAYNNGKKVVMVTFTVPHYENQRLKSLLDMQQDAFKRLRAGEPWKRIKNKAGYLGMIRSLEVTLGENGWHPHTHEAWLVSPDTETQALRDTVAMRWLTMCQKAGLVPAGKEAAFLEHSVHITDNCSTSEYLAKQDDSRHWGADRELAKAGSKTSKSAKGFHPFALLAEHAEGGENSKKAGSKFLEYAEAMRGKAQIFWSKGLKKLVGIDEKTDEELAEERIEKAVVLAQLTAENWRLVIKYNAKTQILDAAENIGLAGVLSIIDNLEAKPKPAQKINQDPSQKRLQEPTWTNDKERLMSLDSYIKTAGNSRESASITRCKTPSKLQILMQRFNL